MGKMGIPDAILLKPGTLTEHEWKIMKQHPKLAFDMLSPIAFLEKALDIPFSHHEKWDGTGYPQGLKGEHIPIAARLFAVVDVWDALCSDRPYRKAWNKSTVMDYIKSLSGIQFDPKIVKIFGLLMAGKIGNRKNIKKAIVA
jgi:HD-GYP domain-containing protein (c-di-GMP phosphodiesterase class II)